MRVFKTRAFARFADREEVDDDALCEAVARAGKGLIDADLGGGVIKQRIARKGQGRSGGFRSIVLFRRDRLAFFVYGFAKRDRQNLRPDELKAYRLLAAEMLAMDAPRLDAALRNRTIFEVTCDG
ncbi:MAG: type II toxin-antitoxin system RelE/ParE family toxin [Defluviicoccus sp.]|nr:type II toxin-antitoxin system RelE/ParE family toxin [Defluviicoccus sp.]MDE0386535.1 type II toxin-antitoxin system RelE/ParE family toxin [Defluviicoccus sp.]